MYFISVFLQLTSDVETLKRDIRTSMTSFDDATWRMNPNDDDDALFDENISLWRRLADEHQDYTDQLRSLQADRRSQLSALRCLEVKVGRRTWLTMSPTLPDDIEPDTRLIY